MPTTEINKLKLNLIAWINQLSDLNLLAFLEGLKNSTGKEDWWDELSEDQQREVLKGIEDADNGKLMSSKEYWQRIKNA